MKTLVSILLIGLLVFGCAAPMTQRVKVDSAAEQVEAKKQMEIAVQSLMSDQLRLYRIAYPIETRAVSLCGEKTRYATGVYIATKNTFAKPLREAAESALMLGDLPKILYVVPGGPADRAGAKVGDVLVALNDWPLPTGEDAGKKYLEQYDKIAKDGASFSATIKRGGENIKLTVSPEKSCSSSVILSEADDLNAFADGKNVVIMRGMMRFAQDDNELALVIAHELSHNAMKHIEARKQNSIFGMIVDVLVQARTGVNTQGAFGNVAAGAFSQEFEAEADYVGLYMMANAGLEIEHAPNFWRRMAAAHPGAIRSDFNTSHPSTPYRMLALEETVKEIKAKQAAGVPLKPEMKNKGRNSEKRQ